MGSAQCCGELADAAVACNNDGQDGEMPEDWLPVRHKELEDGAPPGGGPGLHWGTACMQGWREQMEDAHITIDSLGDFVREQDGYASGDEEEFHTVGWEGVGLFGVMDGHGGPQVARFCKRHLPAAVAARPSADAAAALEAAFLHMDEKLRAPAAPRELRAMSDKSSAARGLLGRWWVSPDSIGCTAVVCCVQPDALVVANAGDSRAVLCRRGVAIDLSKDHKPEDPLERDRIHKAGGWVELDHGTVHRVNGDLNLSRALGDLEYKQDRDRPPQSQVISAQPDLLTWRRDSDDDFLLIACDGIWDVLSSQKAVDFLMARLGDRDNLCQRLANGSVVLSAVLAELLDCCLSPCLNDTDGLGGDNMTAVLVVFASQAVVLSNPPSARAAVPAASERFAASVSFSTVASGPPQYVAGVSGGSCTPQFTPAQFAPAPGAPRPRPVIGQPQVTPGRVAVSGLACGAIASAPGAAKKAAAPLQALRLPARHAATPAPAQQPPPTAVLRFSAGA